MEKRIGIETTDKRRTGIFSGSFNPVHIGHLAVANWLCEYADLDEIWFLITPHNPLKNKEELMDDQLRYQLVEASITGYSKFKVSNFEFNLPQPTYTINTLQALQQTYPDRHFSFIMGADNWSRIERWKDAHALLSNFPILIYPRKGYEIEIPTHYPDVHAVKAPLIEISSTFIRESIKAGKDVRFFLPAEIRSYAYIALKNPGF